MTAVVDVVLPIFGLIGAGALASWRGWFDASVTNSLNLYVVWFALPALLFRDAAHMSLADIDHPGFVVATAGGMAATFALSFVLDRRDGRPLADRTLDALSASSANNGYLGIPLTLSLFGSTIMPAIVIAILMTAVALFGAAIVLVEIDMAAKPSLSATLRSAGAALARNPLVVAPLVGLAWAATGVSLPAPADRFAELLADSAGPCALVTIGLFLAQQRELRLDPLTARLTVLKLVAQPLLTGALALLVPMPRPWIEAAVLLAALPTGTGPFMLAKLYDRQAATTSQTMFVSTLLSVATVSALVLLFHPVAG